MNAHASLFQFSPQRHRDVRLVPGIDLAKPYLSHNAEIGLDEVGPAAADYPLVFLKDADTGQLRLVALFGLSPGQNIYVHGDVWQAVYLPLKIAAAPFCLAGVDRIICIDEANPRVTTDTGDALFGDDLSETSTLQNIRAMLDRLSKGCKAADALIAALLALGLVQPISITADFVAGGEEEIEGLYSIDPQILDRIEPAALSRLHSTGFLGPIYTIIQSLSQFNRIKQLHNLGSDKKISAFRIVMGAS